jgi:ElaB/YqjD/DUF883 family membrane-anchored ribosome-binding protein
MAERLHRRSDVPDFDTYPAEPVRLQGARREGNTTLEEKARQVGSAMGKAVVTLRQARDTLKDVATETGEVAAIRAGEMRNKAREAGTRLAANVTDKTRQWSEAAASGAERLRQTAVEKVSEARSQIKTGYYRTRLRANQMVREYPLHVVLAVGGIGFLLGIGLRIWRSNHEY